MLSYAVGVDLGGTNLRIAAVDEQGKLLEKLTLETQVARGRDFVLDEMTNAVRQLMNRYQGQGRMRGVGIGVPGIIDMRTGMLRESPNLPGWNDYPVHAEIERRLGIPVILENDANAAALGEHWLGAAKEYPSMAMITLGTGVGGGLVLDGKIWHGMSGMAGELGHINVVADGHPCGCGSRGCLEQYASATAVTRMAREAVAAGATGELARLAATHTNSAGEDRELNSRAVYQLAMQGDKSAREVFERVGRALGLVLGGLINLLNLPIYVIGGGVASAWDAFAPSMLDEIRRRSFVYGATNPKETQAASEDKGTIVTRALLGGDAGLYGAAKLPMQ